MGHLADQPARRAARQTSVGVEGDHVAHPGGHHRSAAFDGHVGRVGGAAQQPVQLVQFAALSLPTDPLAFAFVPYTPAMEQEKAIAARPRLVLFVQP
jgi:hypothetical protein